MKKLLTLILILSFGSAYATKVNFTAEASHHRVEAGQQLKVTYTINTRNNNFQLPDFSPFSVLQGPFHSSSMQIINGRRTSQTSVSYVIATNQVGTFNIPPAIIDIGGKVYRSNSLEIEVIQSDNNVAGQEQGKSDAKLQSSKDVYLQVTVDKQEAYLGEKITVSYKLYSKITLNGLDLEKGPDLNGFWSHDIKTLYDKIEFQREMINGEIYHTSTLQQSILYPQRPGTLTIDPMKLKLVVTVQSRNSGGSIFDQLFGGYEQKEIIVSSIPINIEIKPLPTTNKRDNFTGAVGDFKMKIESNKDSIKANEAIDLKVIVTGKGNLPFISSPELDLPKDFEVYDPKVENKYTINYNGASGSKVFNYLIIPRYEGDYVIEPYVFSYFDLESKNYKTIQSDSIIIHVAKGEGGGEQVYQASQKESVEMLNKDIRYIKINNLSLITLDHIFYGSTTFYLLLILILLALIFVWYYARKRKNLQSDQVGLRKAKANKMAKKRLSKANQHLKAKDLALFYEEISAAIYGYYSDKFNIEVANLSLEKVETLLNDIDATKELSTTFKSIMEEAEMARFAGSSSMDASQLYEQAVEIISKTENLNKA